MALLQHAVNEWIAKTVNDKSSKYVYVMSAYSKGPIRRGHCEAWWTVLVDRMIESDAPWDDWLNWAVQFPALGSFLI